MNRLEADIRAKILHLLCEGNSQRTLERVYKVSNKTVAKLFEDAGDMAIAHVSSLRALTPQRIQADEIHSFVGAKEWNVPEMAIPAEGSGTVWAYLAMCADTKLIFAYHLGDRDIPDATAFARKVEAALLRTERGELAVRPLIATDGLPSYTESFGTVFGDEADFGMMIKRHSYTDREGRPSKKRRYAGSDRTAIVGKPNIADIHTSYIERQNANLRMGNRRYTRKSNAFSKTMLNHERHLALWIMYHNLCWMPRPARPRRDASGTRPKQWIKRLPAGIAAGITDRLWEIEDLLALTDEYMIQRQALPLAEQINLPEPEPYRCIECAPTHWVFRHFLQRSTKVHTASCTNCRDGRGKKDGAKTTGEWLPFGSLETAVDAARTLEPDRNSTCNMCLGAYRTLGYRHAGSSRQAGTS